MERPKPKRYENPDYLNFIRSRPCGISGTKPAEPHHVRRHYFGSGAGQKSHDYCAVPRSRAFHDAKYDDYNMPVEREIIELLVEYIESKRILTRCQ